jgi:hypothetical protein
VGRTRCEDKATDFTRGYPRERFPVRRTMLRAGRQTGRQAGTRYVSLLHITITSHHTDYG